MHPFDDIYTLSRNLFVPFPVRKIKAARIVWLNEKWFLEAGINILDDAVRDGIERKIIDDFAVEVISFSGARRAKNKFQRILYADRYGSAGGSPQGGSGRCGYLGTYNAKGIGPTPLVSERVDWYHRHGFVGLSEAIRETVNAEVANEELPHGAIPVVAIIDTGLKFKNDETSLEQRRAIVIRPNFMRPAHFERSIYFGHGGTKRSSQYLDARRVQGAILSIKDKLGSPRSILPALEMALSRFADQIGAARAHRLWQGRFISSNIAMNGALVDFGAFRSTPNWCAITGLPGEIFGNEGAHLRTALMSLQFYFNKYANIDADGKWLTEQSRLLDQRINRCFLDTVLAAVGIDKTSQSKLYLKLEALFWAYFKAQQKISHGDGTDHLAGSNWLFSALTEDNHAFGHSGLHLDELSKSIAGLLTSPDNKVCLARAKFWLMPRHDMYYKNAIEHFGEIAERVGANKEAKPLLMTEISNSISTNRRYWAFLPADFEITGHNNIINSQVIYGRRISDDVFGAWISTFSIDDRILLLGTFLTHDMLTKFESIRSRESTWLFIPIFTSDVSKSHTIKIDNVSINMPAASHIL